MSATLAWTMLPFVAAVALVAGSATLRTRERTDSSGEHLAVSVPATFINEWGYEEAVC